METLGTCGYRGLPRSPQRIFGTTVTEDHKSVIQLTLTFTIESTATLSRPGMQDRICSMARRKCRDVRTVVIRFLRRFRATNYGVRKHLGVSDLVTTPIPPEIPPRLIGYHSILVDVQGAEIFCLVPAGRDWQVCPLSVGSGAITAATRIIVKRCGAPRKRVSPPTCPGAAPRTS